MAHVPHLHLPGPWDGGLIQLSAEQARHLQKVLRRADHSDVSYTDGEGIVGSGRLEGGAVVRGGEQVVRPARELTMYVAAPRNTDRARFTVEKLAELGVHRLVWLTARFGGARVPSDTKARSWAVAGLEQSRGAHLMRIDGPSALPDDLGGVVVADRGGGAMPRHVSTVVIGPEGGWHDDEIPAGVPRVGLGDRTLRTETAAIVAAARVLHATDPSTG